MIKKKISLFTRPKDPKLHVFMSHTEACCYGDWKPQHLLPVRETTRTSIIIYTARKETFYKRKKEKNIYNNKVFSTQPQILSGDDSKHIRSHT